MEVVSRELTIKMAGPANVKNAAKVVAKEAKWEDLIACAVAVEVKQVDFPAAKGMETWVAAAEAAFLEVNNHNNNKVMFIKSMLVILTR
jgi:hypothetical protein